MAKSDKPGAGKGAATRMVHAGRRPFDHHGFINPPLYRGSTVLYPDTASLTGKPPPYVYGRRGTPTMAALEEAIGELDGAAGCVISPSGLGAITAAILAYARAGDHVLVTDSVYRPTRHFCDSVLARLGIETEYYDPLMGGAIKALLKPNTRLVYTESPGSQTMEVQDIPAIAAAAHDHGALVLCDNTWGTPLYFAAIGKGVDVVIHAATKYITGHSDAMLGAISANDAATYPEDSFANMAKMAKEQGFGFPYLYDESQLVARAYDAVCTPDFFGFNAADELQYRGRLDASTKSEGPSDLRRDLFLAMQEVARTGKGPTDQIASMGCSIKWKASA